MNGPRNLWANRLRTDFRAALAVVALLAFVPAFVSSPYWLGVLIVSIYFALLALGWNLLAGFTGQFSLAPAAFAMLGAYATALLDFHAKAPLAVGIPAAIAGTALLGYLLGRIVLRLKGPYVALTTLSFAEIARVVIGNSHEFTRGDQGLNVPTLMESRVGYYYLFLAVLAAVLCLLYALMRGRAGRFWLAIRDDETGAESRGIDVVRYKTLAFALSCAICGLAGSLYGTFSQLVSPELGLLLQTGIVISMVVIGGMGTLTGPIVGALMVYLASEWLREVGNIQMIVFSIAVIVVARFFRTGLWGLATDEVAVSLLRTEGLTRHFGGVAAVDDLAFAVEEGEILGLIGPNGSGKTTALNLLSGFLDPEAGRVWLQDEDVTGKRPAALARRGLLRMFQMTRVFARISAFDNLLTAGLARGLAESDAERRAGALLEELTLAPVQYLEAGQLSGGQRKLLEFGMCFIAPPRIALLDEPFAAVHPQMRETMAGFIRRRNAEGRTFLVVSHDMPIVVDLCGRTLCMNAGRRIAMGPTREVLKDPAVIEAYLGSGAHA